MSCIDLNPSVAFYHRILESEVTEVENEYWSDGIFPIGRFAAQESFSSMCSKIPRQLQSKNFVLHRSVSLYGICPTYLSREPSRHRHLPSSCSEQALPRWNPWGDLTKHPGRCKRKTRLAYLCRIRSRHDSYRERAICRRSLWRRVGKNRLCSGLDNNRLMSFSIPMGAVSKNEKRDKTAYDHRPSRKYPLLDTHYRWQDSRCKPPRCTTSGAGIILRDGSRVYRFSPTSPLQQESCVLCGPRQKQYGFPSSSFPAYRQNHRSPLRSNDCPHRTKDLRVLSRAVPPKNLVGWCVPVPERGSERMMGGDFWCRSPYETEMAERRPCRRTTIWREIMLPQGRICGGVRQQQGSRSMLSEDR